jgi:hypothetical protein
VGVGVTSAVDDGDGEPVTDGAGGGVPEPLTTGALPHAVNMSNEATKAQTAGRMLVKRPPLGAVTYPATALSARQVPGDRFEEALRRQGNLVDRALERIVVLA